MAERKILFSAKEEKEILGARTIPARKAAAPIPSMFERARAFASRARARIPSRLTTTLKTP